MEKEKPVAQEPNTTYNNTQALCKDPRRITQVVHTTKNSKCQKVEVGAILHIEQYQLGSNGVLKKIQESESDNGV